MLDDVAGNICFLATPSPKPEWETMPSLPEPLYGFGLVQLNDLIYVIGGVTYANATSKKVYVLDTNTMTWYALPWITIK